MLCLIRKAQLLEQLIKGVFPMCFEKCYLLNEAFLRLKTLLNL